MIQASSVLVTVIMYTYNHQDYISTAIESVLEQETTFPYALRIHDDCSADATRRIVKSFVRANPQRVFFSESLRNSSPRLPLIEAECDSEFIAYLDGDDFWTDQLKLEKQVKFMRANTSLAMSFHRHEVQIGEEIKPSDEEQDEKVRLYSQEELRRTIFAHRGSVMRRNFPVENPPEWEIVNFDDFLQVQASIHGGMGFDGSIGPSIYRWHNSSGFLGKPTDYQTLAHVRSYYYFSRWLGDRGLEDASAYFLKKSVGSLLKGHPALKARITEDVPTQFKKWLKARLKSILFSKRRFWRSRRVRDNKPMVK